MGGDSYQGCPQQRHEQLFVFDGYYLSVASDAEQCLSLEQLQVVGILDVFHKSRNEALDIEGRLHLRLEHNNIL